MATEKNKRSTRSTYDFLLPVRPLASVRSGRSGDDDVSVGAARQERGARHLRTTDRTVGWCFTAGYVAFLLIMIPKGRRTGRFCPHPLSRTPPWASGCSPCRWSSIWSCVSSETSGPPPSRCDPLHDCLCRRWPHRFGTDPALGRRAYGHDSFGGDTQRTVSAAVGRDLSKASAPGAIPSNPSTRTASPKRSGD